MRASGRVQGWHLKGRRLQDWRLQDPHCRPTCMCGGAALLAAAALTHAAPALVASPPVQCSNLHPLPRLCSSAVHGVLASLPRMTPEALQRFGQQLLGTGSEKAQRDITKKMLVRSGLFSAFFLCL